MKKLIPILLIVLAAGCVSQKKIMNSYMGAEKQTIYKYFGPPSRTSDDGSGGEILLYARQGMIYISDGYHYYWEYKMFYLNTEGKVYWWRIDRSPIPPTQIDLNIR
jgi:hypothetical protein